MAEHWIHRISHKSTVSYPLLKEGYLSIGFSDHFSNEEFLENLKSKNEKEAWKYFERFNKENAGFGRSRYSLWRFLHDFKVGDIVLVPMYKSFSVYKITGDPIVSGNLKRKIVSNGNQIEGNKSGLLFNKEKVDIGFLIPIEIIEENISRNEYADSNLTSRMKMRQTNGNISDLKDSIECSIKSAREHKPISLYGEIIEEMKEKVLAEINSKLSPKKFERLVLWYLEKIGADEIKAPSTNESFKQDGADGDIIADFELLKVRILVQVKHHKGETNDWAVKQIQKYSEQHKELGDGEYTYINWALTSANNFTQQAIDLAAESDVRLINGLDFAEMLIEAGLEGLDQAFICKTTAEQTSHS